MSKGFRRARKTTRGRKSEHLRKLLEKEAVLADADERRAVTYRCALRLANAVRFAKARKHTKAK
jgi:hypothetical protein